MYALARLEQEKLKSVDWNIKNRGNQKGLERRVREARVASCHGSRVTRMFVPKEAIREWEEREYDPEGVENV